MQTPDAFLRQHTQNYKLPIRLVAPGFGHLPPETFGHSGLARRASYYFLLFMVEGRSCHGADLQQLEVGNDELLFVLPQQLHQRPPAAQGTDYYKLGFDETCLALLPRHYPFLVNPLNNQKIRFSPAAAARVKALFGMLRELLRAPDTPPDLLLAHLNSLLTEINAAYFASAPAPADDRLAHYLRFRLFVENNLVEQPSISAIAAALALNSTSLYSIVKHYSGLSPKTFITHRLILEARRRLYYSARSVKELAYELGFNDPEYFARVFKKVTGQTVSAFVQDLSGS